MAGVRAGLLRALLHADKKRQQLASFHAGATAEQSAVSSFARLS
jgi:hypothetical protein